MTDEIWRKPFKRFIGHMEDSERLTKLTYHGIEGVAALVDIGGILNDYKRDEDLGRRDEGPNLKDLSAAEISSGFPLLHAHAIMGEWGALECLIEDLVESWVQFKPEVLEGAAFSRVRIPLASFLSLSEGERAKLLIFEVQRDLKVDLISGATKFEKILDVIGLGGPVDPRVRDALYEAQNVRNVWAHRGGIADRRLIEACPTLGLMEGDKVNIGRMEFSRYRDALWVYAATVLNRCLTLLGKEPVYLNVSGFEGALGVTAPAIPKMLDNPEG
ncbi:hypothetical protein [Streptomyces sp. NPDC056544]|uniref:hypothetical protein n=1 Tax=unclassified Streptomyces TaxID=2593676 RepID=UPI00369CC484